MSPQHRVVCDCGFEEQSVNTETKAEAWNVLEEHQEEGCGQITTIWEAIHASSLHIND